MYINTVTYYYNTQKCKVWNMKEGILSWFTWFLNGVTIWFETGLFVKMWMTLAIPTTCTRIERQNERIMGKIKQSFWFFYSNLFLVIFTIWNRISSYQWFDTKNYTWLENYNNFWLVKTLGIKNPYSRVLLGHITGCN
jgi:hypothetical protein